MKYQRIASGRNIVIHRFGFEEMSSLVEVNGRSLLIDCHASNLKNEIEARNLPLPEMILHTHVAPEHCREGSSFVDTEIRVPAGLEVLASEPIRYQELTSTTWDAPEEWLDTMGSETYGVGGCTTYFPPDIPLRIGGSLLPGSSLHWHDLSIELIPLPAHGQHSLGFLLREDGEANVFFPGDLFRHPAHLVNIYDLVTGYGLTCIDQYPRLLRMVAGLGAKLFLPATGEIMVDGPAEAIELAGKVEAYLTSLEWVSDSSPPRAEVGGTKAADFVKVGEGIYQDKAVGNTIVLIDEKGRGLVVDPGPCQYGSEISFANRQKDFSASFDYLEAECALKTVDLILITHLHGDHYDMAPLLRKRYPASRLATWDELAKILENPAPYPYSCLLPWYNLGLAGMTIDTHLPLGHSFEWQGQAIEVVHLPGHCHAHCGFILDFRGERLAITGDTIQNRGEACSLSFIITNDSEPFTDGVLQAFLNLQGKGITLNLGGHGSRFKNCENLYQESILRIRHALDHLQPLIHGDNYDRAFRAPNMRRRS